MTGSALVGVAVTPAAFGALIDRIDWPGTFLLAALATFVLAAVWARYTPSVARTRRASSRLVPLADADDAWRGLLDDRSLILLTLSYAAVGYFQYLFFYSVISRRKCTNAG